MYHPPRYHSLTLIDPDATPDPSLPVLPSLVVTVASDCDHTPHLNLQPDYESCKLLHGFNFWGRGGERGRACGLKGERGGGRGVRA